MLVYTLSCKSRSIDTLYELSFLLTLAGLLLVPALCMGDASLTEVSSALCEISSSLFALVMWLLVARIGARSPAGALPVLCMVRSARGLGIALGLVSGMFATGMGLLDELRIALLAAGIAFVFAAFNFRMAHSFSFDATVRSVRPLSGVRVLAEAPGAVAQADESAGDGGAASEACGPGAAGVHGTIGSGAEQRPPITDIGSRLDASCAQLAREYRLTSRETDVLRLLARGRNAAYIQQELALTHSTVKSYVADVYRKLNVHSHQELIDLVEHE